MPHCRREVERCQRCGGLVDVSVEYQYSAQGHFIGRLIRRFRCRRGCTGRGVLDARPQSGPIVQS